MNICTACNEKVAEGSAFCSRCGAPIGPAAAENFSAPRQDDVISEQEYAAFVGKNAEAYLRRFRKFNSNGADSFSVTWNWWAFLFPVTWMLYRKLYLWALLAFVLELIVYTGLLSMVAFGITGHYIYYRNAKKKILEIKRDTRPMDTTTALSMAGGVNQWVIILVCILVAVAVAGIILAILIPQFA